MNRCDDCGCYLDPGEGRLCEECREMRERKNEREKENCLVSQKQQGAIIRRGIGPESGRVVEEGEAFSYALERCLSGTEEERQDFRTMLVEWYYSGNWVEEEEQSESDTKYF